MLTELPHLKELQKRERKIERLRQKLRERRIDYDLAAKLNLLRGKQNAALANYLLEEKDTYRQRAEENMNLLQAKNVNFKVTGDANASNSALAYRFAGYIAKNGYLYLMRNPRMNLWERFAYYSFSSAYQGSINFLGFSQLEASAKQYAFIGDRLPRSFKGNIEGDGSIRMTMVEDYWEWANCLIIKMIGDPFRGREKDRTHFLENRHEILKEILSLRKDLL